MDLRINRIRKNSKNFRVVNRELKGMFDTSSISEEMARNFDYLKEDLK